MVTKVLVLFVTLAAVSQLVFCSPYFDEDESEQSEQSDLAYMDNSVAAAGVGGADSADLMDSAQKRSCIRRGGSCDYRRNDCCFSSACRCNLWGSNCRCHRAGLFQKWG